MILIVNSIINFFIIILFCIIIICVGISRNNFFLFLENMSVIKYLFGDYLCKKKKLFLVFNLFKNIYLLFRFYLLSIYFRYELFIKIFIYCLVYLSLNLIFIKLFGLNHTYIFNKKMFMSHVQYLYQSSFSLEYILNIINNEQLIGFVGNDDLFFFIKNINHINDYTEKNIILNIIDVYTNIYNVFLGTNEFHHLNDETNVKLLIQTVRMKN